jgi:tetratricopeptide (TPR) repeat protein
MSSVQLEIGNSYQKLKKYDEALAAYAREKDLDGDSSGLELAIAEAYDAKGMRNEAAEARKKAEKLKSEEAEGTDD